MSILPADITREKSLPSNVEIERLVLGIILLNNSLIVEVKEALSTNDFFLPSHRKIYAKMLKLWNQGAGIDPLLLQEELTMAAELDQVGGPAYIASLFEGVPRLTDSQSYTRIIKQKSMLRQLIGSGNGLMQQAFDAQDDPEHIAARFMQQLTVISQGASTGVRSRQMGEFMDEAWDCHSQTRTVPTGFAQTDSMLLGGGLGIGNLNIIAARTSQGKSTLAMQMDGNICDDFDHFGDLSDRKVVAFFSIEMTGRSLARRIAAIRAELPWSSLQRNQFTAEEFERLAIVRDNARLWRNYVTDIRRLTPVDIARECKAIRRQAGRLDAVIIDYAGLIQTGQRFNARHEEVAWLMRELKIMAGELEVAMVVPVQVNREGAKEQDILLQHMKEGGAIEESADLVMIIQQPQARDAMPGGYGLRLTIEKQREGAKGSIGYQFNDSYGGFSETPNSAQRGLVRTRGQRAVTATAEEEEF